MIRALRKPGAEAQFTQVIAELAAADQGFASAFIALVLRGLAKRGSAAAESLLQAGIPTQVRCTAEQTYRLRGKSLGRVDLVFEGDGFALLIENKLHSSYGKEQLERYAQAVGGLDAEHVGLAAITRNFPTFGERTVKQDSSWLGSVRWADLVDDGLRELTVADEATALQWKAVIDVMQEDGDLGSTKADQGLIQSWARYKEGREHLARLLEQISEAVLADAKSAFKTKHRGLTEETSAALWTRGKRELIVKPDQLSVSIGLCVPALVLEPALWIGFIARGGSPSFEVGVWPWEAQRRLLDGDKGLKRSVSALEGSGFDPEGNGWWTKTLSPDEYLADSDVPARLLTFASEAIQQVASSKVLAEDVRYALAGKRGQGPELNPKKLRKRARK